MHLVLAVHIQAQKETSTGESASDVALKKLSFDLDTRRSRGAQDGVLLIGTGFSAESELSSKATSLGLGNSDVELVIPNEDEELGEQFGEVLGRWLNAKHPEAVAFLKWRDLLGNSDGLTIECWWAGVEASVQDELDSVVEGVVGLAPADFRGQARTWLALTLQGSSLEMFESELGDYEICMMAMSLARWLSAYEEVSGNSYFDFEYQDALQRLPVDQMRLAREAWLHYKDEIEEAFDDEDATAKELSGYCLKACLTGRADETAQDLKDAFGSSTALLWALYSAIWPQLSAPMEDAALTLVSGSQVLLGELMPQWQFIEEGWGNITED